MGGMCYREGVLIIMAKNYRSEADLVTKQPNSVQAVGIFSLSTGNMGTGTDLPGAEVNGNYKLDNVVGGDIYRYKTSSLKNSHVSFADSDEVDMIKTYSEMDLIEDPSILGLRLGRSISCSAIERTNQHRANHEDNMFYKRESDTYSLGSAERLSNSPIQEEVAEGADRLEVSEHNGEGDHSEHRQTDEHSGNSTQDNSSRALSPLKSTGKPPLPNGKSKLRPAVSKQTSWLLRLFESKMFDMSIAISYLFNSKEPGVQTYLGKGHSLFRFVNYILATQTF